MGEDKHWSQDDPALKPWHPSDLPWTSLPAPSSSSAVVSVSLLLTGRLTGDAYLLTTQRGDGKLTFPDICALVEKDGEAMLFDLGIRPDPENFAPPVKSSLDAFKVHPRPTPIYQLKQGGYDLGRLKQIVLSHVHFDHCGDLDSIPSDTPIYVGPGSLAFIDGGYPNNKTSPWPAKWLEEHNLVELPPTASSAARGEKGSDRRWEAMGCFEHAMDWFGDGSFWVMDTGGHVPGHMMGLARVTADPPTYILLGGDAAHSQDLYLPIPPAKGAGPDTRSPIPVIDGEVKMTADPVVRAKNMGQLTRMSAEDNVMVLLAHEPEAEAVLPLWPETANDWRAKGYKRQKQKSKEQ